MRQRRNRWELEREGRRGAGKGGRDRGGDTKRLGDKDSRLGQERETKMRGKEDTEREGTGAEGGCPERKKKQDYEREAGLAAEQDHWREGQGSNFSLCLCFLPSNAVIMEFA